MPRNLLTLVYTRSGAYVQRAPQFKFTYAVDEIKMGGQSSRMIDCSSGEDFHKRTFPSLEYEKGERSREEENIVFSYAASYKYIIFWSLNALLF